jgi:hypothetical protein
MTRAELAQMLERFLGDLPGCGDWEWDDFTSVRAEPDLEPFRQRLAIVDPPTGEAAIRQIIFELRADA